MAVQNSSESSGSSNINKVVYIGSDIGYFQLLSDKLLQTYKQLNLEFEQVSKETGKDIQSLIPYLRTERPKIIYVDFSTLTSQMLHLVRVLTRLNGVSKPAIIGLVDYNQGIGPIQKSLLAGIRCVHIKSAELDAVVFDSICFGFPESIEDHGFATAKLDDEITAYIPCKVGIIARDGIRIESNFPTSVGSTYNIHSYWYNKGFLKTPQAQCASSSSEDLYYNFKYAQEFGFEFVQSFEPTEEMEPEQIEQLEQERVFTINDCKERMENWVDSNLKKSVPKLLKTLMIDKSFTFYDDQPLSDEYPFVIRCQPYLINVKEELLKTYPQLIVFNMEDVSNEELEANEDIAYTYNETRTLQFLVKVIKTIPNYTPFIIVFNAEGHDTEKLQKVLSYKQIISHKEIITPALVLKMAKLLETRLNSSLEPDDVITVFLQKDHPASYGEIELSINIIACSENDLYFNSEHEITPGTVLRINLPAPMFLAVVEPPKNSRVPSQFYAVIHGIGEVEKKELRRFINSVFFREHEQKKQAEKEEIEKKKQALVQKKEQGEAAKAQKESENATEEQQLKERQKNSTEE